MRDGLYTWIYSLLVCGCLTSIIMFLAPDGKVKTIVETGCSCVMFLALINPLLQIHIDEYIGELASFSVQVKEEYSSKIIAFKDFNKEIIEQKFEEYIMNEAENHDVVLNSVKVNVSVTEENIVTPNEIVYESDVSIPTHFYERIESQLGVPMERQRINEIAKDHAEGDGA